MSNIRKSMIWITVFWIMLISIFSVGYALIAFIFLYLPTLDITEWSNMQRFGFLLLVLLCGIFTTAVVETEIVE
jgi:hypothetical protein